MDILKGLLEKALKAGFTCAVSLDVHTLEPRADACRKNDLAYYHDPGTLAFTCCFFVLGGMNHETVPVRRLGILRPLERSIRGVADTGPTGAAAS